eukprot:5866673-Prymnesium_polylepis.1
MGEDLQVHRQKASLEARGVRGDPHLVERRFVLNEAPVVEVTCKRLVLVACGADCPDDATEVGGVLDCARTDVAHARLDVRQHLEVGGREILRRIFGGSLLATLCWRGA